MKTNIRDSIFETNSSSVHSLVFLNQKLSKPNFRELRINKDGVSQLPRPTANSLEVGACKNSN